MSSSYLDILPVEILNRILNNLDTQTILFSFRCVCKRFHSIVSLYNDYDFNFESISKTKFLHICLLIPFEKVVSLTLSDKDKTHGQIKLFNLLFDINQFVRLRSLTLLHIENDDLKPFLHYVIHSSLISITLDVQKMNPGKPIELDLLSSTIENCSLQKLNLNMLPKDMKEFYWPLNSEIKHLRIMNSITFNQYYTILWHSPVLQTIVVKDFNVNDNSENILSYSTDVKFLQLRSLTCEDGRIQMNRLEQCLTLTPALVNLKLIGFGNLFSSTFDGYQWEELIKTKLPLLEKFDFFISVLTHVNFNTNIVARIISSFQTSFWLNEKKFLIICDYVTYLHKLIVYSLPVCTDRFVYYTCNNKFSVVNFITSTVNYPRMMDNIKELHFHLTELINVDDTEQENDLLFRNVTELKISMNGKWPEGSFRFLSTLIDLSRIVTLSLLVNVFDEYTPIIVHSINELLKYAPNISILSLYERWPLNNCTTDMKTVCAMITPNIKHLYIRVKSSDEIKFIIENFKHLQRITFEYTPSFIVNHRKFIECMSEMKRHISKWECQNTLDVWLDKT